MRTRAPSFARSAVVRTLLAGGLSLSLVSSLAACGVEFPGDDRRDRVDDDDDRRDRRTNDDTGNTGGGIGDLFGGDDGSNGGGTPGGNSGGNDGGNNSGGNSGGNNGSTGGNNGNTGGSNNDAALACTPETHCSFVEGVPTCDPGYIYSLTSVEDLSCRAPTLLESQKTAFACDGEFPVVALFNGMLLGFAEGADEAEYVAFFRELPNQNLQIVDITETDFVTTPVSGHTFWTGMTDSFEDPGAVGACQLAGSLAATAPTQWVWEDDFCESGTCSFKENTFTVDEGGGVEWHLEHGVSSGEYSDTYYSRRYGYARIDSSGFVNLVFPATEDDPATQFFGLIDNAGDFYDEARGEWLLRQ